MFSTTLLRYEVSRDQLLPSYLDDRYAGLAQRLLLYYESFAGRPYKLLVEALAEIPELRHHESRVVAGLQRVIEESLELTVDAPLPPPLIREAVFNLAAAEPDLDPESVYHRLAERLKAPAPTLEKSLYADLRLERRLRFRRPPPGATELISRYNFRLLQGLLLHAVKVRIESSGQLKPIYRFAKLHGLLVEARNRRDAAPLLEISGPLSLFQKTRKYGYALARFLPACCVAGQYQLDAQLHVRNRALRLLVNHTDRVLSSHRPPREFDSKLERRFFRDFVRLGSRWNITRETELIPLGSTVFLPDFTFELRDRPEVRIHLEVIGFWTRDYLARKRALLSLLPRQKIIFCVDRKLACDTEPFDFPCIWFAGRVPAKEVVGVLEASVDPATAE